MGEIYIQIHSHVGNCCALLYSWAFNDIKSDNKNFGSCHGHYSIMSCFTNSWYVKIRTFNLTRTFGTGKKIRILYLILYWVCNYVEVYLCKECIRQKITAIFNQNSTLMLLFLISYHCGSIVGYNFLISFSAIHI